MLEFFNWIQNIHLSNWMAEIYTTAKSRSWLMGKYFQVTIIAVPKCGVIPSLCFTDSTAHGMSWNTKWSNFFLVEYKTFICLADWPQFIPKLYLGHSEWKNILIFKNIVRSRFPQCREILTLCLTDSSQNAVTFKPIMQFRCPLRNRIDRKYVRRSPFLL